MAGVYFSVGSSIIDAGGSDLAKANDGEALIIADAPALFTNQQRAAQRRDVGNLLQAGFSFQGHSGWGHALQNQYPGR